MEMMITEIGITAGEIWRLLDENGEMEFCDLLKKESTEEEVILMALGWLCREGHVLVTRKNDLISVNLREGKKEKNE